MTTDFTITEPSPNACLCLACGFGSHVFILGHANRIDPDFLAAFPMD
jgi:hypothetical protein